jgi:nucleotide-binding universal stress UspA family protein
MFEKILVPLDGSELAEIALPYAQNLAVSLGSEIHLIHVSEPGHAQHERMHELYIEKMGESVKQGAELHPTLREGQSIKVKSAILKGDPAGQIVDYADQEDISVINMATHGRSGITRWVMGSVADKVIRATNLPVVIFRTERPLTGEAEGAKYLITLDGSKESEAILPYVEELGSKIGGEVVILAVVTRATRPITTPGAPYLAHSFEAASAFTQDEMEKNKAEAEAYMGKVCSAFEGKGIKTTCEVRFGAPAEQILKFASEMNPHIVMLATHGRSPLGRATIGSTADKLLHEGNTPLLLVKA